MLGLQFKSANFSSTFPVPEEIKILSEIHPPAGVVKLVPFNLLIAADQFSAVPTGL